MAENKWLFATFVFLSIIFLTAALAFFSYFVDFETYLMIGILSLFFGFITGIILNKNTESQIKLVIAGIEISIIVSLVMFSLTWILTGLDKQIQQLSEVSNGGAGFSPSFFGTPGNPFIQVALIYIFFNIAFLINYIRNDPEKNNLKKILPYVYGIIILAVFVLMSQYILKFVYGSISI